MIYSLLNNKNNKSLTSLPKTEQTLTKEGIVKKKILPGSSEPQSLGVVSYKDMTTSETTQQTQSVDSTSTVLLENVENVEKLFLSHSILPFVRFFQK